jgi:hypothetical protein
VALSDDDATLISRLQNQLTSTRTNDLLMLAYYQGRQRLQQLGMSIPPNMRQFMVVVNWPRVVVDTICGRQQVRSLVLPGAATADPTLRAIWDASNLTAHLKMFNRDRMIFGRAFLSVGANESHPDLPWVRVESPLTMSALVDVRTETMIAAARFYGMTASALEADGLTLYQPDATRRFVKVNGLWIENEAAADVHNLGRVPIIMHLNRRMSGGWAGESELTDIIPLTDSAARSLTNLQFAQEAHGVPRMWMTGVARGDFIDEQGKPLPQWEAYYDAIHTLTSSDARVGQLTPADLQNFQTAVEIYGKQAATITGFPARYFGLTSTNPPSADAIRADEAELVRSVEDDNDEVGMSLGWAAALAYEFATGEVVEGNRVRTDWFDPGTPTVAQRTDAVIKLRQTTPPSISREGMWDEMGWDEARKAKERAYLAAEAEDDPELAAARALTGAGA